MGLKGGYSVRKAEVKIKHCENPLEAVMQIGKPVKFQRCLSNESIEKKIEYGLEFQFEYFILHLKSGLLKQLQIFILWVYA